MIEIRPRRSALYLPASNMRALEKARTLPSDVIILDLEDSVAPDMKDQARAQVVEAVRQGGFGRAELVVRVNGLDTPWGAADMDAVAACGPAAVLVPKVNDRSDIERYHQLMNHAPAGTSLWAMIETARCLFRLDEIAAASRESRLSLFVMGTNDLAKEMGAALTPARTPFLSALSLSVAAARAYGLGILDGVFNDLNDADGFAEQCRQGVEFGFDGKTLIHPRQIDSCNAAFSPSLDRLDWARAVISAFDLPENANKGAISVEGKMVERLHLVEARRILAIQNAIDAEGA
ncbi:MAG: CoA ester lyase [Sphingobium sp.]|nr:CoA ester lyase [Sphingobium sp.]MCI1270778.1 CoA ester lyase [Sphingobium sp.]MCI1756390.1 CoA ester lyase [Sphingobium sp.]MCI2051915.1 CoA ester lyase [Sphingobium sp.]